MRILPSGQLGKCVVTMSRDFSMLCRAVHGAESSFTVALTGNGTVKSTSTPTVTTGN